MNRTILRPLNKHIVVQRAEVERKRGGLYLPENAAEKPQHAEVLAVDDAQEGGSKLHVGDTVLLSKWSGIEVKYDGKPYLLVKEADVLAVIVTA